MKVEVGEADQGAADPCRGSDDRGRGPVSYGQQACQNQKNAAAQAVIDRDPSAGNERAAGAPWAR